MGISLLLLVLAIGLGIFQYIGQKQEEEETLNDLEIKRKDKLKSLIENREERISTEEFNELAFWEIIDHVRERSRDSYKDSLGLLSDFFSKRTPDELIQLDNLVNRLIRNFISHDLRAASTIIFKNSGLEITILLMHVFMIRGQVFFKQACLNPDLVIGKKIEDVDGRLLNDIIADLYLAKTGKLIPMTTSDDQAFEIKGEIWTEKDLPSRYPNLWMAFA